MTADAIQLKILAWLRSYQERYGLGVPESVKMTPASWEALGKPKMIFGMRVELVRSN